MLTFYLHLVCGVVGAVLSVSWLVQVRMQLLSQAHARIRMRVCSTSKCMLVQYSLCNVQ